MNREKIIENMNVAKAVLCNPNMVTPEMCIKVGQTISDALSLLKEQDNCENCAIAIEDRQLVVRCKDCVNWIPGTITDKDDFVPPKCGKYHQMVGHSADDYCSLAERKEGR